MGWKDERPLCLSSIDGEPWWTVRVDSIARVDASQGRREVPVIRTKGTEFYLTWEQVAQIRDGLADLLADRLDHGPTMHGREGSL